MSVCCFVNSEEPPIDERHICYYVRNRSSEELDLMEIVELKYPHPEAPMNAFVTVNVDRVVKTVSKHKYEASDLILLQAIQTTVRRLALK